MLCYVILCYLICYVAMLSMLCYIMLWYLSYVILSHVTFQVVRTSKLLDK